MHHIYFLQRLKAYHDWISGWALIGARKNLPIVAGWLQAICGLQTLIQEALCTHNFSFVLTGRFNQDAVEVNVTSLWYGLLSSISKGISRQKICQFLFFKAVDAKARVSTLGISIFTVSSQSHKFNQLSKYAIGSIYMTNSDYFRLF